MDEPLTRNKLPDDAEVAATLDFDQPLLTDDLEAAYLRALEATETIELEIGTEAESHAAMGGTGDTPQLSERELSEVAPRSDSLSAAAITAHKATTEQRVTEKQIVEAALFVGGMPLTAKRLSSLFHTDHGFGFVECLIDELNKQYAEEGRPYAIVLGEGGYRLSLLPEFEAVRNKYFGYGPKEVKLSQDVLEVLALVAYKQPITKTRIEELGKDNPGPALRQLLQRELIRIDRPHGQASSKAKHDPVYVTTPRFLSLFGLGSLLDLPVAEDFEFK
jgi:segregation and condensation protein B